jgi:uncharacterized caspase-like protein
MDIRNYLLAQRQALLIGNSEYDDPNLARLVSPAVDVNGLADLFRAPEIGGFDEVTVVINQTAANIRREIARFFSQKKRDDLLLLYFSGHGVLDDRGRLHLAAKDSESDLLSATAIEASFVTDVMDRSFSRRQVLVLDCCHSGAFAVGTKGVVGASVGTASAFEGKGYGRVVLTATDATQYAWEGDKVIGEAQNSVFTRHFIRGLQTGEADTDFDGEITLDELFGYVYERVLSETPKQTPAKWSYKQQGDIILARNPFLVAKPAELPQELRLAMESPFASVREGAVRELEGFLYGSHAGLSLAAHAALQSMAEDDSRRVSRAAAAVLAKFDKLLTPQEEAPKEEIQFAAGNLEADSIGIGESDVEPDDRSRLEPEASTVVESVETSEAETGFSDQQPQPAGIAQVEKSLDYLKWLFNGLFRTEQRLWLKPIWIAISWLLGIFIIVTSATFGWVNWQTLSLIIGGAIGGSITGLAWRRLNAVVYSPRIMASSFAIVGIVAWIAAGVVIDPIRQLTDYATIGGIEADWSYADLTSWLVAWTVFGIGSALILRWLKLIKSRKQILAVWGVWFVAGGAGWALSVLIPYAAIETLASLLYSPDPYAAGIVIQGCLAAFFAGLVGGFLLAWQHLGRTEITNNLR